MEDTTLDSVAAMFTSSRSKSYRDSFSGRIGKERSKKQKSFRDYPPSTTKKIFAQQQYPAQASPTSKDQPSSSPTSPNLHSAIVTISVGPSQRLFAAHEDILSKSPYFAQACRSQFFEASGKRVELPDEEPEVFSAVLEYLYKGDYTPKLLFDKKRTSWYLDDCDVTGQCESTVYSSRLGVAVLKDTVIYVSMPS